jgi:hypothetical protein
MLSCGGIVIAIFGFVLFWLSRSSEGLARAFPALLGLILIALGLYFAVFETGEGLARFLPFLGS